MMTQKPPGPLWARRLSFLSLLIGGLHLFSPMTAGCRSGASKKRQKPQALSSRCPKAVLAWSLSDGDAPYRKAGLSTNPSGREEALMPEIPTLVHKWAKACRAQKQWVCSSTAVVGFLEKDAQGTLTSIQAITPCPAARCLARQAAKSGLQHPNPGTDICVYVEMNK